MDKLKGLVEALNEAKDNISSDTGIMFRHTEENEDGEVVKSEAYFIKMRPVREADGIERLQFVARLQK
ncbi:MAG TPA: hypothetical protein VK255_01180 [Patescibacteria group bacterium]|nr:hypothetical protein [Patescibacteria group bacterium]